MEFIFRQHYRNIPPEELLEDLRNVATILNKDTVTIDEYENYGKFHPSTLKRRFGSWFNILKKAGLKESRSQLNISDGDLFQNLAEIWVKLGRQPKYSEVKKPLSKYSAGTYENHYGSFSKTLDKFIEYMNADFNVKADKVLKSPKQQLAKHKTKREISDRLRFRILMRDGFTCKKCGRSPIKDRNVELHVDHIIPWSKGGETVAENLETKCDRCNLGKGNEFCV